LDGVPCQIVDSELDLINTVIDMVKHWDPDVLAGWELHNSSWGWVSSRADQAFGMYLNSLHLLFHSIWTCLLGNEES
jgi:DNA polymerase zeta